MGIESGPAFEEQPFDPEAFEGVDASTQDFDAGVMERRVDAGDYVDILNDNGGSETSLTGWLIITTEDGQEVHSPLEILPPDAVDLSDATPVEVHVISRSPEYPDEPPVFTVSDDPEEPQFYARDGATEPDSGTALGRHLALQAEINKTLASTGLPPQPTNIRGALARELREMHKNDPDLRVTEAALRHIAKTTGGDHLGTIHVDSGADHASPDESTVAHMDSALGTPRSELTGDPSARQAIEATEDVKRTTDKLD